jgi:hypothetical protein
MFLNYFSNNRGIRVLIQILVLLIPAVRKQKQVGIKLTGKDNSDNYQNLSVGCDVNHVKEN